jgi:hypothetical protein
VLFFVVTSIFDQLLLSSFFRFFPSSPFLLLRAFLILELASLVHLTYFPVTSQLIAGRFTPTRTLDQEEVSSINVALSSPQEPS